MFDRRECLHLKPCPFDSKAHVPGSFPQSLRFIRKVSNRIVLLGFGEELNLISLNRKAESWAPD